jgi:hypothetical protein
METVSRTIYSSYLQTVLLTGLPFRMAINSTLNELFGIQNNIAPVVTPTLGYYAIGNGGHKMTIGANGLAKVDPIQHSGTDAALYNHIPFVLRDINNDIDSAARALYALRRIETHNGKQYIAYYLKRLSLANVIPDMEFISIANGVQTTTAFVPNNSNLNPTPPALNNSGVNIVTGDYVAASAKVDVALSADDISELINAATIVYGDPSYAIISEIALCSGVDKIVQSPAAGNTVINFNEAICVQVLSFINSFYALEFNTAGIDTLLDIGCSEPILNLI